MDKKRTTLGILFILGGIIILFAQPIINITGYTIQEDAINILKISFPIWAVIFIAWGVVLTSGSLEAVIAKLRAKNPKRKTDFQYTPHAGSNYVKRKGWTEQEIKDTIRGAERIKLSRDKHSHDLTIVYFDKKLPNQYVIISKPKGSKKSELIQLSNKRDRNFKVPDFRKYLNLEATRPIEKTAERMFAIDKYGVDQYEDLTNKQINEADRAYWALSGDKRIKYLKRAQKKSRQTRKKK